MTMFPISEISAYILRDSREIMGIGRVWTEFHNLELKGNVISWNVKHCFQGWIFRECESIQPSLQSSLFTLQLLNSAICLLFWNVIICIDQLFVYNLLADAPDPSGHGGSCNTGNKARNFFKPGKNRDAIRSLFKVICLHNSCLFTIWQFAISLCSKNYI